MDIDQEKQMPDLVPVCFNSYIQPGIIVKKGTNIH